MKSIFLNKYYSESESDPVLSDSATIPVIQQLPHSPPVLSNPAPSARDTQLSLRSTPNLTCSDPSTRASVICQAAPALTGQKLPSLSPSDSPLTARQLRLRLTSAPDFDPLASSLPPAATRDFFIYGPSNGPSAPAPDRLGLNLTLPLCLTLPPWADASLSKTSECEKKRKAQSSPTPVTKKNCQLNTLRTPVWELALPPAKQNVFLQLLKGCIRSSLSFVNEIKSVVQTQLRSRDFSRFLNTNEKGMQVWYDPYASRLSNRVGTTILKQIIRCDEDFSNFSKNPSPLDFKKFHSFHLRRLGLLGRLHNAPTFLGRAIFHKILNNPHEASFRNSIKTLVVLRLMKLVLLRHMQCVGIYIWMLSNYEETIKTLFNMGRRLEDYKKAHITTCAFLSDTDKAIEVVFSGRPLPADFWSDLNLFSDWVLSMRNLDSLKDHEPSTSGEAPHPVPTNNL